MLEILRKTFLPFLNLGIFGIDDILIMAALAGGSALSAKSAKKKKESEQERQEDLARQAVGSREILADQLLPSFEKAAASVEDLSKPSQAELFARRQLQQQAFLPAEEQFAGGGELAQSLLSSILGALQGDEFTSTLGPLLEEARQRLSASENARGFLSSGRRLESLGRAGIDLAVQEAAGRLAQNQQARSNAFQLTQATQDLGQRNLGSFLGLTTGLRQRALQGAQMGGQFRTAGAGARAGLQGTGQATKEAFQASGLEQLQQRAQTQQQQTAGLAELATLFGLQGFGGGTTATPTIGGGVTNPAFGRDTFENLLAPTTGGVAGPVSRRPSLLEQFRFGF